MAISKSSQTQNQSDYLEAWEERAAIMEYCGKLPRAEAEYRARRCLDEFAGRYQVADPGGDHDQADGRYQVTDPGDDHDQADGRSQAARAALSEARAILRRK